jgi:hypothetical protein
MPRRPAAALALLVVAVVAVVAGCASRGADAPAPPRPALAARAPVVVTIVVDAFAAWEAEERLPKLPESGGFARLRREGTWVLAMRFEHAPLDTAPGHAALYSGVVPRTNGIVANEIVDRRTGDVTPILLDPRARVVGAHGAEPAIGQSAAALRAVTFVDRLRAEHPRATIVSLSIKDRAAILGGGHAPTASVWYDRKADRYVTSSAFASELPSWARTARGPASAAIARGAPWAPADARWLGENAPSPDAEPGEADYLGLGRVFPHDLAATTDAPSAFRATPFADDAILTLAIAALDAPRDPHEPLLLALSLSANDYVGHVFGPDSWESWDELRRLDAELARFFAALDARFGADGWSALVTGDHGATPMPEAAPFHPAMGLGSGARVEATELLADLREAARRASLDPSLIAGVSDPYVYLAASLDPAARASLVQVLQAAAASHPGVARLVDVRALPRQCPGFADESIDALVCRSVDPGGPGGDLYVVPTKGSFFTSDLAPGAGSAHGSPYDFDRTVPLLVRAPGRLAAGARVDASLEFASFARTAATLLGVAPPAGIEGGVDLACLRKGRE